MPLFLKFAVPNAAIMATADQILRESQVFRCHPQASVVFHYPPPLPFSASQLPLSPHAPLADGPPALGSGVCRGHPPLPALFSKSGRGSCGGHVFKPWGYKK